MMYQVHIKMYIHSNFHLQIVDIDVIMGHVGGAFNGGWHEAADLPHETKVSVIEDVFILDELSVVFGDPIAQLFVEHSQFRLLVQRSDRHLTTSIALFDRICQQLILDIGDVEVLINLK